ncbi:RNA-guided endonuclease InsQ/TnpB family protein [Armatimonas sp.]|uniref:RNA-guided endonuclease InsQ/TnpB family protein n=1 Tax=Armatimonas sp. TaxID=1872638 RepID=UPI00374D87F5
MQKAYKYRAYPSKEQEQAMLSLLNTHRHLYNEALSQRKHFYESEKRTVTYKEQSAQLTQDRKVNPYLAGANFSSCQRTLRRLDRAMQAFFRRIKAGENAHRAPGYPRFRGYGRFDSVEFTIGDGAKLTKDCKARFMGVGDVKIKMHRPILGDLKTARFKKEANGWYVVVSSVLPDFDGEPSENPSVGIDLGLKSFFVDSNGDEVKPPKLYRKAQKKLKRLQRAVARKKRGGSNRRKAVKHLAKFSQHVKNQRGDFHHKTALDLVKKFGKIAHEDLNVKSMIRSLNLAKSCHDAGWSGFIAILSHKAESAGVEVVAVNPRHTTQTCSNCGCLPVVSLTLRDRLYNCLHCGFSLDRDFNAAINIKNKAFPCQENTRSLVASPTARTEPLGVNQEDCLMDFPRSPRL